MQRYKSLFEFDGFRNVEIELSLRSGNVRKASAILNDMGRNIQYEFDYTNIVLVDERDIDEVLDRFDRANIEYEVI